MNKTRGLLTIVLEGRVLTKIIVNCGGEYIDLLAAKIRASHALRGYYLNQFAQSVGFGCQACRVIMASPDTAVYMWGQNHTLPHYAIPDTYSATFHLAEYHPLAPDGYCDYVRLIEHPVSAPSYEERFTPSSPHRSRCQLRDDLSEPG